MKLVASNYLRDIFSFSKLNTFAQCPRLAFYRYVAKVKMPPAEYLLFGRAAHFGQETDNAAKVKGQALRVGEVLDAAVEAYRTEEGGDVDRFAEEHGAQLREFEDTGERGKIRPMAGTVEAGFDIKVIVAGDPVTVEGFVDVVSDEEGPVVVDYKTSQRGMSEFMVGESIQLGLYSLAAEAERGKIVSFIKEGRQHATTRVTRPVRFGQRAMNKVLTFLADTIEAFRRCLKTGDWPKCAPTCYWCSHNSCQFYDKCYPKDGAGLEKLIQVTEIRKPGTVPAPDWRKSKALRKEV